MKYSLFLFICSTCLWMSACSEPQDVPEIETPVVEVDTEPEQIDKPAIIDLNNWKVTLPIGNPTEVEPPAILDYANNSLLKEFMFNDESEDALVFYTYPSSTTANSSYSRTELREQMVPGSNSVNWTFKQGGQMKGILQMDEISKDKNGDYHRAIIMQIHGRLTNEQRDRIGQKDNNAPPVLKIYWNDERVRVLRKVMKKADVSDDELLPKDAWTDEGFWFEEEVGFDKFQLEIKASDGRLEVILNDNESMVFEDKHVERWSLFENYFKAGNYLITRDEGAFSRVKYYELHVKH